MPALLGAAESDEKRSAETYAALGPAKARFEELGDEERLEFRDALDPLRPHLLLRLPDRRLHGPLAGARLRLLPRAVALPPRHRHGRAA